MGVLRFLGWVAVAPVAVLAGVVVFLGSDAGRDWVTARLLEAVPTLRVGRVEGSLLGDFAVTDLRLADEAGPWLTIDRAELRWRPWSLLRGRLYVSALKTDGVDMARRPRPKDQPSGGGFTMPRLPVALTLRSLDVTGVRLGSPVMGTEVVLASINGSAALDPGGGVELHAVATSAQGEAAVDLSATPGLRSLDLAAHVVEPSGGLVGKLAGLPADRPLSVRLDGRGPASDWHGTLSARAGEGASVDAAITASLGDAPWVTVEGRADPAALVTAKVQPLLGRDIPFELGARRDTGGVVFARAEARTAVAAVTASGRLDRSAGVVTASVDADLVDASLLGPVIAPAQVGGAVASARVSGPVDRPTVIVTVMARDVDMPQGSAARARFRVGAVTKAPLGNPAAEVAVDGDGLLSGLRLAGQGPASGLAEAIGDLAWRLSASVQPNAGRVDVADVQVSSRLLDIAASGSATRERLAARYSVAADDLGAVGRALGWSLAGSVRLTGTAAGQPDDPSIAATLTMEDTPIGRGDVEIVAESLATAPRGRVQASLEPTARLAGARSVRLSGDFSREGQRLLLAHTRLTSGKAEIVGSAAVSLADGTATGQFTADSGPLAEWAELAGAELAGRGRASLDLTGRDGTQAVSARLTLDDFAYGSGAGPPARVGEAVVEARVDDARGPGRSGRISVTAKQVGSAAGHLNTVRATVEGTPTKLRFASGVEGDMGGPMALDGSGSLSRVEGRTLIVLDRLRGVLGGEPLRLARSARLELRPDGASLDSFTLAVGQGRVVARGELSEPRYDATVTIDRLPLRLGRLVAPKADLGGVLTASARLRGNMASPSADFRASVAGFRPGGSAAGMMPLDGTLTALWDGRVATVNGVVQGLGAQPVRIDGTVPVRRAAAGRGIEVPRDQPVSGHLAWTGEAASLWRFLRLDDQTLSGRLSVDLAVTGTVAAPHLGGDASLGGGRYENLATGTILDDATVTVHADERGGPIHVSLTASDGGTGQITGQGMAGQAWDAPVEATLAFNDATVVRRDDLTASGHGRLSYQGTARAGRLSGEVTASAAEVRIDRSLPPSAVKLDVIEVNAPKGSQPARRVADAKASGKGRDEAKIGQRIALAIQVIAPNQVYVRGRGLDSEWQGRGTVGGTVAEPAIDGRMEVVRGEYTVIGKTFDLTRGVVTMDPKGEPRFDITAEHEAKELTAQVHIAGTADEPKITWDSVPPMPRDEILAQVLFGRGTGKLGPAQLVQLTQAVAGMSGLELPGGGTTGILDGIRTSLGLDVLQVGGDGSQEAVGLSAGKYITDKTYVGVKQGITPDSAAVTVEIEVLPHVNVETEVGAASSGAGVSWRWDY